MLICINAKDTTPKAANEKSERVNSVSYFVVVVLSGRRALTSLNLSRFAPEIF